MELHDKIVTILEKLITDETIYDISAAMSKEVGTYITPPMLESYRSGKHTLPAHLYPAFAAATKNYEILEVLVEASEHKFLRGKDIAFFNYGKLEEIKQHIEKVQDKITEDLSQTQSVGTKK